MRDNCNNCHCKSKDRMMLEHASFVFKEVANGIYCVIKDRPGILSSYTGSEDIVKYLNSNNNVAVIGIQGSHANFDLPVRYPQFR